MKNKTHKTYPAEDCGAVDQAAFEKAIQDNLSPEAVVMIVSYLQLVRTCPPEDQRSAARAARQIAWFRETLVEMIGCETYNRMVDELGL